MWSMLDFFPEPFLVQVLDIGASMSEPPLYQRLVDAKRAKVIGFEPNAAECEKLNQSYGPPHRFFPYFVGNGKPAIFHETNCVLTGSLYEPNTPLLELFHGLPEVVIPVAQHSVITTRLDDLESIVDVDHIKIDVQGGELDVFQNADRILADVTVIQTEVSFVELYKKQPFFSDIDSYLRSRGFVLHTCAAAYSNVQAAAIEQRGACRAQSMALDRRRFCKRLDATR